MSVLIKKNVSKVGPNHYHLQTETDFKATPKDINFYLPKAERWAKTEKVKYQKSKETEPNDLYRILGYPLKQ
jgi:hypothetical protein